MEYKLHIYRSPDELAPRQFCRVLCGAKFTKYPRDATKDFDAATCGRCRRIKQGKDDRVEPERPTSWKSAPVTLELERTLKVLFGLSPRSSWRWRVAEARGAAGRVVVVRGVGGAGGDFDAGTSVLLVYNPDGELVGSFTEPSGWSRGAQRRRRVEKLLGKSWSTRGPEAKEAETKEDGAACTCEKAATERGDD